MSEISHDEKLRRIFAQRIANYEKSAAWMLSPALIEMQRLVVGRAPVARNTCLDIYCRTGIVGRHLLDLGWQLKGLDQTPEMGFVASQYFPVKIGSVEDMSIDDESFDLAILRQSEMLMDFDKGLREIYRILKPGGRFILVQSTAFGDADDELVSRVQWIRNPEQKNCYRTEDLKNAFLRHGFDITDSRTRRVRESVDHWLNSAAELRPERRTEIRELITGAPAAYKKIRNVQTIDDELFEDWNWLAVTGNK